MLRQQHGIAVRREKNSRCRRRKKPRSGKGFNLVCANLLFWCADSRFAEPRIFLKKVLIVAVRSCRCGVLIRGLQNLGASCERNVFRAFCVVQKEPKSTRGEALRPTIQSSAGKDFVKLSGGSCRNRFCLQNAGVKALNRCERVTVVQTQDCFFSKKNYCAASSQ